MSGQILAARLALVAAACGLIGVLPYLFTGETTEIVTYTAPQEEVRKMPAAEPAAAGEPGRLWGVIVPLEADVWFFKLTGPIAEVAQRDPELRKFLQTVEFSDGRPQWKLPANWTQKPGSELRFATIVVPAEKKLMEMTVIKLVRNGPWDKQLLDNVNRWREQITLPPVAADDLGTTTEKMTVAGVDSTLVNLEGVVKPSSMGRPPFASPR